MTELLVQGTDTVMVFTDIAKRSSTQEKDTILTSIWKFVKTTLFPLVFPHSPQQKIGTDKIPSMNFFSFFETGSCSVAQAGVSVAIMTHCSLNLLSSSDPPASASQVAGITGMNHRARPTPGFPLWSWSLAWKYSRSKTCYCHVGHHQGAGFSLQPHFR